MSRCFRSSVHVLGGADARRLGSNRLHFFVKPVPKYPSCARAMKICSTQHHDVRRSLASVIQASPVVDGVGVTIAHPASVPEHTSCHDIAAKETQFMDPASELNDYLSMCRRGVPVDKFRSLYAIVKQRAMLHRVSSKQMTNLMSLFGTLSIPSPQPVSIYMSKHVPCVDNSEDGTHWPFVLEVAKDKEGLGYTLSGTDRFWIMRAELASVPTLPDRLIRRSILRAKMQYVRIWRHTPDPEVHVPFLEVLVSSFPQQNLPDVVKYLCRLLVLYDNPHHRLLDILWTIVLRHGSGLTAAQRANLLLACFTRSKMRRILRSTGAIHRKPPNLGAGMASHMFPHYFSQALQDDLRQWIQKVSVAAFDPKIPLETRWLNLVLLAVYIKPHGSQPADSPSNADLNPGSIEWRTALVLSTLERAVSTPSFELKAQILTNILHPLWRMWTGSEFGRHLAVSQAFLASFLGLAGVTKNKKLFETCAHYAELHELWSVSTDSLENRAMHVHVLASYLAGLVQCQSKKWPQIFRILDEVTLTNAQHTYVISLLLQRFIAQDAVVARELYQFCQNRGDPISIVDTHRMAMSLVSSHQLHEAVSLLDTPGFSPFHTELLLGEILRTFQTARLEIIEPYLAAEVGGVMERLYAKRKPLARLKYPIWFFMSIMVSSGHPSKAVDVIEAVIRTTPSFFTARTYTRLIRSLFHRREFKLAVRVVQMAQRTVPSRSIDITRDKLVICLANAGAVKLAQGLYQDHDNLSPRLSMLRVAAFRFQNPTTYATLRILRMLFRMPSNEQTIKFAVTLLVRARRLYAARKLVQAKCGDLTQESVTVIGNTILHGLILHQRQRNGRLVANLLSTKILLEDTCKFTPDRLTTNIIIKAILQWHTAVDTSQVKSLFDHITRLGYPVGNREWQGAPFGTPSTNSQNVELPMFTSPLSFRKHVKPLYKSFIKAFYLRADINAAKTVVGILKEETIKAMQERERRERARREGIQKKNMRTGQHPSI